MKLALPETGKLSQFSAVELRAAHAGNTSSYGASRSSFVRVLGGFARDP